MSRVCVCVGVWMGLSMHDDLWSQWPSERVMAEDVRVQWRTTLGSVLCVCVCEELSVGDALPWV